MEGTQVDTDPKFDFGLKLDVGTSDGRPIDDAVPKISTYLEKELKDLERYLQNVDGLSFIHMTNVSVSQRTKIHLHFSLNNIQELEKFSSISGKGKKKKKNELSEHITKYASEGHTELAIDLPSTVKLSFNIFMPEKVYLRGKLFFMPDDDDSDDGSESVDELQQDDIASAIPERGEDSSEDPKTVVNTDVPSGKAEINKERPDGEDCGHNQKQIKRKISPTRIPAQTKKITFYVAIPIIDGKVLQSVFMRCYESRCMNEKLNKHYGNIYTAVLEVPDTTPENIEYWYEADYTFYKHKIVVSFGKDVEFNTSKHIKLKKYPVVRDIWGSRDIQGIFDHLLHIIQKCSNSQSLDLICKEVERLLEGHIHFVPELANNLILPETKETNITTEQLVHTIVFAKLYSACRTNRHELKPDLITQQAATKIIDVLRYTRIQDIPEPDKKTLETFCIDISGIALGNEKCPLGQLYLCYDFLGADIVLDYLLDAISHKRVLVNDTEEMLKMMRDFCGKLYEEHFSQNDESKLCSKVILEKLFKNVPLSVAIKTYKHLFGEENFTRPKEVELQNSLYANVVYHIEPVLILSKNQKSLQCILENWEVIHSVEKIRNEFKSHFEEAVIEILGYAKINYPATVRYTLRQLCVDFNFFESADAQKRLLRNVSKSTDFDILSLFTKLTDVKQMETGLGIIDTSVYRTWIVNILKKLKTESDDLDLCKILQIYSSLIDVETVTCRADVKQTVDKEIIKACGRFDIKIFLTKIISIESSCRIKPVSAQLLEEIFHELLEKKFKDYKPHEILLSLCGTDKKLRVNSNVTAEAVCMLLNKYCPLDTTCPTENFKRLLSTANFWYLILNVEGKPQYTLKVTGHKTYTMIKECIDQVVRLFQLNDVSYDFVSFIQNDVEGAKRLLASQGMSGNSFENLLQQMSTGYLLEKKKLMSVLSTIETIESQHSMPKISILTSDLNEIKENIESSRITAKQMKGVWKHLADLPMICEKLNTVTKSKLFWNVCTLPVKRKFLRVVLPNQNCSDASPEESIRFLFEDEFSLDVDEKSIIDKPFTCQTSDQVLELLQILVEIGVSSYREAWLTLKEGDVLMRQVIVILHEIDLQEELKIVDKVLNINLSKTKCKSLTRVCSRKSQVSKIDVIKAFLKSVCLYESLDQTLYDVFESCKTMLTETNEHYTFQQVDMFLHKTFEITENLSEDTLEILSAVSKSTNLLNFLQTTANEEFSNLIDAVEDISEQQVDASTVLSLIEVKRFLHPILTYLQSSDIDANSLLNQIDEQTRLQAETAKYFPSKIVECTDKINNLKTLYNNVANRGEQTKEVITNIVERGTLKFFLGRGSDRVRFEACYKKDIQTEMATKNEAVLTDLRSRALLLMNSEWSSIHSNLNREHLLSFVKTVDLCFSIRDILQDLYVSGHVDYVEIDFSQNLTGLLQQKEELWNDYKLWMAELDAERKKNFLLNFVQGFEFLTLSNYINDDTSEVSAEVVLKYIHPDMKPYAFRQAFFAANKNMTRLGKLGWALHEAHRDLVLYQRPKNKFRETTARLTDFVANGKPLIARLQENSLYVLQTVLTLYINTTRCLPEPYQILFCNEGTLWRDIILLLRRCIGSYSFYGLSPLFCIANVEMLPNALQFKLVSEIQNMLCQENFLLAILCKGTKSNPFMDELHSYVTSVQCLSDQTLSKILAEEFSDVCTYISDVPGLGKTTEIYREARSLQPAKGVKTLHISDPFNKVIFIKRLQEMQIDDFNVLHIDIYATQKPSDVDIFLFELIILRFSAFGKSSWFLRNRHFYVEISNTINDSLRNSLHTLTLFREKSIGWKNFENFVVSREVTSSLQVVCHYLSALDAGQIDRADVLASKTSNPLSEVECKLLLQKYISTSADMSFAIVNTFVNVLGDQLKKMSKSAFFRVSQIYDMVGSSEIPSVRSTLLKEMINVSLEFAFRSVNSCRNTQRDTADAVVETEIREMRCFENDLVSRTKGMIRWIDSNHLIYVFHNQNIQTLSPMYRQLDKVPTHIQTFFKSQMKRDLEDFGTMSQEQLQDILQKVARTKKENAPQGLLSDISEEYALTPDNILKMVLIMMRIQAKVPVIVMGETGCGKTSLIRYLATICEIQLHVLNIHAGVNTDEIVEKVMEVNSIALKNLRNEQWLFLDEVNTSENIGLICDIICHHRCLSCALSPNLTIMGACNPYRIRSKEAVFTAGLDGKVKEDALSRLVYRVHPLPETMVNYVWDFGSLSEQDEQKYVNRMLDGFKSSENHSLFCDLVCVSQRFVRSVESSACVVSLRDVHRCNRLAKWFLFDYLQNASRRDKPLTRSMDITAMILALTHCYHSRFSDKVTRQKYRESLAKTFVSHKQWINGNVIHRIILAEQNFIIDTMVLPPGTARNTALQENIFVLLVCILNKIPIFVVGKPGCSKSLAMQIIRSNLRGLDSRNAFLQSLPQLLCVSFQGSESSTSEGIIKVFEKADAYQEANMEGQVLSVVVLDEIGLAEISRFNPLKVLHSLLEPGGNESLNVAVVGISNWVLDASKMNRAIHLSRPDMDKDELYKTGIYISKSFTEMKDTETHDNANFLTTDDILEDLQKIAISYADYSHKLRFENFHGLRDFYSLVKYVASRFANTRKVIYKKERSSVIRKGLERNFGGLPKETKLLYDCFSSCLDEVDVEVSSPIVDLITDNISDPLARHLMIITKGESIISFVEESLRSTTRKTWEKLIGSQFIEDKTDDYDYRMLSKIILCMEQGTVLVLKDLESIYGSLYDMLNQHYTIISQKKNCRVALGAYSNPFCEVADTFRCIVIVDSMKVDYTDPPFLNRFEKQFLSYASTLTKIQTEVEQNVTQWVETIKICDGKCFDEHDIFPNFNEELIVSLAVKVCREHKNETKIDCLTTICKTKLLWIMRSESVIRLQECSDKEIKSTAIDIRDQYFVLPIHQGITKLVEYQNCRLRKRQTHGCKCTVIFTNTNIHTKAIQNIEGTETQIEKLGNFKSEKQLSERIQHFWLKSNMKCLFVQCNSISDEKHILLTKSIIERFKQEFLSSEHRKGLKLAYLVIHLEKDFQPSSILPQINYLSGWKLIMMDCLESRNIPLPVICKKSVLETIHLKKPLSNVIQNELFWAFTRIKYGSQGRDFKGVSEMLSNITSDEDLLAALETKLWSEIKQANDGHDDENKMSWQVKIACDLQAIDTSTCYIDALERYIINAIKVPLAKLVYRLESLGAFDSFFLESHSSRKNVWMSLFLTPNIVTVTGIPDETGPESYICDTPDLKLELPFSLLIYENIESHRDDFMLEVQKLKSRNHDDDDMHRLLLQQENKVLRGLSMIPFEEFQIFVQDYINDFCNLSSLASFASFSKNVRIHCLTWALSKKTSLEMTNKPLELFVRIHCFYWINTHLFKNFMYLVDEIRYVLPEFVKRIGQFSLSDVSDGSFNNNQAMQDEKSENREMTDDSANRKQRNNYDSSFADYSIRCMSRSEESLGSLFIDKMNQLPQRRRSDTDIIIAHSRDWFSSRNKMALATTHTKVVEPVIIDCKKKTNNIPQIPASEPLDDIKNVRQSNENNEYDSFENLVSFVCMNILPNSTILSKFDGAQSWQKKIQNILTIASEVSGMPTLLYSLRFCVDITNEIIIPLSLSDFWLEQIGNSIENGRLDSEDVFKFVKQVAKKAINLNEDIKCLSVISQYLVRCFYSDTRTKAYRFIFELVLESILPENVIEILKPPLYLLIEQEVSRDKEIRQTLLKTDEFVLTDSVYGHFPWIKATLNTNTFFKDVDIFLKCLAKQSRTRHPIVVLIADLLQEIIYSSDMDQTSCSLTECGSIIQNGIFGLNFVAAVACLKADLKTFGSLYGDTRSPNHYVVEDVSAVLKGLKDTKVGETVHAFLLKTLMTGSTLHGLITTSLKLQEQYSSLKMLQWTQDYVKHSIEDNPLALYVPQEIKQASKLINTESGIGITNKIDTLVEMLEKTKSGCLLVYALAAQTFYFSKFHQKQTDTVLSLGNILIGKIQDCGQQSYQQVFLKCLVGIEDFKCQELMPSENRTLKHYCLCSVLITTFALALGSSEYHTRNLPLLTKCLLSPCELRHCFLPGFPDEEIRHGVNQQVFQNCPRQCTTCMCGQRIASYDDTFEFQCATCKTSVKQCSNVAVSTDAPVKQQMGYVNEPAMKELHFSVRNLSSVSCQVLYILMKGCVFGSIALGIAELGDLREYISLNENENQIWDGIMEHWERLKQILNVNDYHTGLFLHAILSQCKIELFQEASPFSSSNDRKIWESLFENKVRKVFKQKFQVISDRIVQCDELFFGSAKPFEQLLFEADDIKRIADDEYAEKLPGLFRITNQPTKDDFVTQLKFHSGTFKFLELALDNELLLDLPIEIYKIVQWHLIVVSTVGFTMRSDECSGISVQSFLRQIEDTAKKELFRKRFDDFKDSWSTIKKKFDRLDGMPKIEHVNIQTDLSKCIITEKSSDVYSVLSTLVSVQNEFIDRSLILARECRNLHYLSKGNGCFSINCISVTETRITHLIDMQFDWSGSFARESHCSLTYGNGQSHIYDFDRIEQELIFELLVGKSYLEFKTLPKIVFLDELYKSFALTLTVVRMSVTQTPLSSDIITSLRDMCDEEALELLNHIGMLLTVVKNIKCEPKKPLIDFVRENQSFLGKGFPTRLLPSTESECICLCHIVSLHETLEDICAICAMDSMESETSLCQSLDTEIEDRFKGLPESNLQHALSIQTAVKRFIYRCLFMREAHPDQHLVKFLADETFWPDGYLTDGTFQFGERTETVFTLFSGRVLVGHARSIVLCLSKHIEEQKSEVSTSRFEESDRGNSVPNGNNFRRQLLKRRNRRS